MLAICQQIVDAHADSVAAQLDVGALLFSFGFLSLARRCFEHSCSLAPNDFRPVVNLANIARESGDHAESRRMYSSLLAHHSDHPLIRRNILTGLEYDLAVSDADRRDQAMKWGQWAMSRAGGPCPRPLPRPVAGRPLRIGYLSADFCQHTVGLFVKDVIKAHSPQQVIAYAYGAGAVKDWVTDCISESCLFRNVAALDDAALSALIRQDAIDVLVDLSGHTAGSRLTVFAHRPAPVLVSWLGYFATTGLSYMDAVLLDEWHAPEGSDSLFSEDIIRLPGGRLVYVPVSWAPEVLPGPVSKSGHITFGCFNNTSKLNDSVFDVWASILKQVPGSRLVLKWRNFNDQELCERVTFAFGERGIAADRLELRGPSFHVDLLNEYADIDIALDPFPFTGGLTSCEALWMGVPVVTWPQSRVVSRQTFAFLSVIGLPELAAKDAEDYVRIATALAGDLVRLSALRQSMRERMRHSPLCDVAAFTKDLENVLLGLFEKVAGSVSCGENVTMSTKILLNVGAGHPKSGACIPAEFQSEGWRELRLDIDPANEPDILGTMLDMSAVGDASVDAIYSSHNIEHLYPNEIPLALKEFLRVLKPDGFVVITCPDLQAAARMIADDQLMDTAYTSPAGPVTPFDIVYSHRQFTDRNKPYMAHHCGFTLKVLISTLQANGFQAVAGKRRGAAFDLWVVATKSPMSNEGVRELAEKVLP